MGSELLSGWTSFSGSARKNVRGKFFRREIIDVDMMNEKDPHGVAMRKCQERCNQRTVCCMACSKPKDDNFHCEFYDGKFGGRANDDIEAASTNRGNERCAFKNENYQFHENTIDCIVHKHCKPYSCIAMPVKA